MGGRTFKTLADYATWFPITDAEFAYAHPRELARAAAHVVDEVHAEREMWTRGEHPLQRRQVVLDPKGAIGVLPGEPSPRVYVPILSGQEPDASGKIFCVNPAHDDQHNPNMHVYSDHVFCFKCGFGTKIKGFAAMVLGLGMQEGTKWETHSSVRPAIEEHLFNLGLARGGESADV